DPGLIRTVYSTKGNFVKTDFYSVNDVKMGPNTISNIFATRSNEFHAAQVRPIQQFYTMNGVKEFEPLVDNTISVLLGKIDEQFANSGKTLSLDFWLLYFTWDVVGEITYSQTLGFLENAADVDDILSTSSKTLDYFAAILAGSDTTALTLRAILYYTLKNPQVQRRLCNDLAIAKLTLPISYDSTQKLPYLDAVIRESMRMHPSVGLPLERTVPPEGLKLPDGRFIPAGTAVGMNAWVIHQNKEVFGENAESFVPERWLQYEHESETSFQARRSRMREADLTFGAGNRVCLGKNIALLQLYKVVATLFIHYDMELADPVKEWHVQNSWFVRQTGVDIIIAKNLLSRRSSQ
ncbi:MAG: hypothetical protein Q9187_007568, partial [Circinaria calcarea]